MYEVVKSSRLRDANHGAMIGCSEGAPNTTSTFTALVTRLSSNISMLKSLLPKFSRQIHQISDEF